MQRRETEAPTPSNPLVTLLVRVRANRGGKLLHVCSNRCVSSGSAASARLDVVVWQIVNATVCTTCCRPCPGLGHSAASDREQGPIASDSGLSFLHCNKTIVCSHAQSSILRTHVVPALLQAVHSFPIHDACSPIDTINRGLRLVNIFALYSVVISLWISLQIILASGINEKLMPCCYFWWQPTFGSYLTS
ncbi:hypothetical protein H112_07929 [Trichophyton rubrum D6]|uniref:Uncharacterized protein n=2 Tax=Trichophyton rubrum TaxID=5551 RepID=A0A080WGG0_TRIRC|nr:uncharacterized protein TERG_11582 [Trichophyton rubrum CBS 118892]EZF10871.1 hypothetical protein H100_07955 [Trichophyton rubrum MR850]EZF37604.1 hypothetical protein H102_07916 [Trichophyton rubrum CBS 100081]EZF48284.1 hypothetical protein H103_07941 [Trichophyton rubrum CBS 288.86]EZF59155.1 hypothetical protein H104_07888 [Trichophyton rubrum CBS 289.86]EZF80162.1 hypothetical protein H110_07940 [Trichophyton rubrum MR1448]EZF90821.1 hypothetical protein H113_08003 [Trichophyton rubr